MNKIYLGSGSPRRKELLDLIWSGEIEVVKSDVEEIYPDELSLDQVPFYLAKLKANDLKNSIDLTQNILLTADTIVLCENQLLGKPKDNNEAIQMLNFLSNKSHQVITGVAIYFQDQCIEIVEKTEVFFTELAEIEIRYYVDNFSPLDKAGSYGVQDYIGMIGIHKINGCYYNVMGLPTSRVKAELNKIIF